MANYIDEGQTDGFDNYNKPREAINIRAYASKQEQTHFQNFKGKKISSS